MLAKISNFENFSKFLTQTLRNIVHYNQIQAGVIYKVGTLLILGPKTILSQPQLKLNLTQKLGVTRKCL